MKVAMILMSMLFAGSVFAQEPTTPAPEGTEMSAPAETKAPAKKEHKKKGAHAKKKNHK